VYGVSVENWFDCSVSVYSSLVLKREKHNGGKGDIERCDYTHFLVFIILIRMGVLT
jgi:hypothetical protein